MVGDDLVPVVEHSLFKCTVGKELFLLYKEHSSITNLQISLRPKLETNWLDCSTDLL